MDVAFKVTYNDGNPGIGIGYKGICSEQNIIRNMDRVNCSLSNNPCRIYYDSGFKSNRPKQQNQCYEKNLFTKWQFGSGMYHQGTNAGVPIPIKKVFPGDVAILTTRFPDTSEKERKIIGLYQVSTVDDTKVKTDGYLIKANKSVKVELQRELAERMNFWEYHKNKKGSDIAWNTGLFRYMEESEVNAVVSDLSHMVTEESQKETIEILTAQRKIQKVSKFPVSQFTNDVIMHRKYGSGGEGSQHKKLKEWVARNPDFLGLREVQDTEIDSHTFLSGDRPDIIFKCSSEIVVVEIETFDPYPGAYQAIKYRDLMCAELNEPLLSTYVRSFLVAHTIPEEVKRFCERYSIESLAKDPF